MNVQDRVLQLKELITMAAVACGLNLTVHEGKIGFVDMEQQKIVALWAPEYTVGGGEQHE